MKQLIDFINQTRLTTEQDFLLDYIKFLKVKYLLYIQTVSFPTRTIITYFLS